MNKYVGIDIGGTNIKYGLIEEDGQILHKGKLKTSSEGSKIIEKIKDVLNEYQKYHQIKAVGISVPGVVEESGFLTTGGAIFDFYGIHLKEILERELGLLVSVENDANSAALAEKWLGEGRKYSNYFTAVVGTGIGGAIIINNEIYRGAHATAGEFGFMITDSIKKGDTRLASLSLNGSVQSALVQRYQDLAETAFVKDLNGEMVFELANKGDDIAKQVIEEFYHHLSIGLFNIITAFDPQVVLVGGGISSNTLFIEELNKRVQDLKAGHRDMKNMTLAEIKSCHFFNDAGIIGATYKAMKEFREQEMSRETRKVRPSI